ncbi:hypothetical protein SEVIR_9G413900v4 [Setaria viridis]|uniref:Phylloplanin n=1 Tax=Setaria viridis TaxID=4556 RepID=A0A4U6T3H7_SETVI|nr:phylloplanin-like [Setaria viridis]TKV96197.1 hypothetical protein SEVIR_9G413900v2 [Setaria viridis]
MAPKSLVLAALLTVVVAAGQVTRCAGLGASPNASVVISGAVPCSTGNNINVATAPAFPNATVQFMCYGKAMAGATADSSGNFVITIPGASRDQLTAIMSNQCNLVVTTPLAACDASLAGTSGKLVSPMKFLGITTGSGGGGGDLGLGGIISVIIQILTGILSGILNLAPQAFSLIP